MQKAAAVDCIVPKIPHFVCFCFICWLNVHHLSIGSALFLLEFSVWTHYYKMAHSCACVHKVGCTYILIKYIKDLKIMVLRVILKA